MSTSDVHSLPNPVKRPVRVRRYRPQVRQRLMEQFENCEQSLTEFCEERGLCRSSLWRWLAQRRREQRGSGALVEISSRAQQRPAATEMSGLATVRVELMSGARLEIAAGTDPAWLAALVQALSAAGV